LRFSLSRKLGIDPRSLFNEGEPNFIWKDEATFKNLTSETAGERAAICSFGISVSRILIEATKESQHTIVNVGTIELRNSIISNKQFVGLRDLIALCWSVGIPIIHLRVFPLAAKHMCAMSVHLRGRYAILLSKDAVYPASIAFYLAHELGHIALGHIKDGAAVVDLADPLESKNVNDDDERAADRYALELLTGMPEPKIDSLTRHFIAKQLAENVLKTGPEIRIEPGTLALCYGYTTGNWAKVHAAMRSIYARPKPVWEEVNGIAEAQIEWQAISDDLASYLHAVLGGRKDDSSRH
jgi:hypothetical protein